MIALIRSEFLKAFTTKLLWILALSALGFVLLTVVLGVYLTPGRQPQKILMSYLSRRLSQIFSLQPEELPYSC